MIDMQPLKFDSNGLLTAVAQDVDTGQVLMVAMMDARAVRLTLKTRQAHFWSRSRKKLWLKGETSGNILDVQEIRVDCDRDAVLLMVKPRGPACHTGNTSCFFRDLEGQDAL
jgi:phosphoribosyl-AMP cyclohydrolase